MNRLPVFFAVLLSLLSSIAFAQGPAWPKMHANVFNSGVGIADGSDGFGQWQYQASGAIDSSPAIDGSWNIYFGTNDGYLISLDEHGNLRWKFKAGGQVYSPAIGGDGYIYAGSEDSNMYKVDPMTGAMVWQFKAKGPIRTTPTFDAQGDIVFGSNDHNVYSLSSSGTVLTQATVSSTVTLSPACDGAYTSYFVSDDGNLFSFQTTIGTVQTIATSSAGFTTSPVCAPIQSIVIVGSADGNVYAYGPNGLSWSYQAASAITSTPALGPDGTIYFGTKGGVLYAYNQAQPNNPAVNWVCAQPTGPIYSSPALGDNGVVYFGSDDGHVYAASSPGNVTWQVNVVGSKIRSSPAINYDGTIMVGAENSTFYAIGTQSLDPVVSISVTPSSVVGGAGLVATVNLAQGAPVGGDIVNIHIQNVPTGSPAAVPPPCAFTGPLLLVPQFHQSAQFVITTIPVPILTTVQITAISGFTSANTTFTVGAPPLTGWQLTPGTIVGGNGVTGNAVVSSPVSQYGEIVTFERSPHAIPPKDGAIIPYPQQSILVGVVTTGVDTKVTEMVGATAGGVTLQAPITILPASLVSITLNPTSVVGGIDNSTASINLDGLPGPSGCLVILSSSDPQVASCPSSFLVYVDMKGNLHNTFTVTTTPVSSNIDVTITGTFNKVTKTGDLLVTPPQLSSFAFNPNSVLGGQSSTGVVSLSSVTPSGGITVQLATQSVDIQIPSSVTVPQGSATASFTATSSGVPSTETESATATWDGVTLTANLTLTPPTIQTMSVGPTVTIGGSNTVLKGVVTLTGPSNPATNRADVVTLTSSDTTVASVTPTVSIFNGASAGAFTVTTFSVLSPRTVTITATFGGASQSATITVNPVQVAGIALSPQIVGGGSPSQGQVAVTATAGPAGYLVSLSSEKPEASVPATVMIPAGASVASFVVTTKPVTKQEDIRITGSYGTAGNTAILTLVPTSLGALTIVPVSLVGGNSAIGTVQLNGAALPPGLKVGLSSSSGDASVPGSVTIPAYSTSATFAIKTKGVATTTVATITAKLVKNTATAKLTIMPAPLQSLTLSTGAVIGDSSTVVTGTVTLAGFGSNTIVSLSSSDPAAASVPASVKVPSGKASANFTVTHFLVSTSQTVTITASAGGVTETAILVVNPMQVVSFTLTPTSVVGGKTSAGVVTLNAAVGSKPVIVQLSTSSSDATAPATVSIGGKQTVGKFTVKTTKVTSSATATITASLGSSNAKAVLAIRG